MGLGSAGLVDLGPNRPTGGRDGQHQHFENKVLVPAVGAYTTQSSHVAT
jgi:hypothetical protein